MPISGVVITCQPGRAAELSVSLHRPGVEDVHARDGRADDVALDAAARYPDTFAVMGRLPIEDPTQAHQLATWRLQPGMLGLRFTFHTPVLRQPLLPQLVAWQHDPAAQGPPEVPPRQLRLGGNEPALHRGV